MWKCRWLVEQNVYDSFDGGAPEEVKSLTIKQELGFSVEEHISRPGYLALLKTLKIICPSNFTVITLLYLSQ
jgi:hypothetical protein